MNSAWIVIGLACVAVGGIVVWIVRDKLKSKKLSGDVLEITKDIRKVLTNETEKAKALAEAKALNSANGAIKNANEKAKTDHANLSIYLNALNRNANGTKDN